MLPWAHLAFAYVLYTVGVRLRHWRAPAGPPVLALALGTQLPDLIDKPLNWWFDVLDGRGIGHSLLFVIPLVVVVMIVARRRERTAIGTAFGVGIGTHLLTDAWAPLVVSTVEPGAIRAGAPYLLWPLWPAPSYEKDSFLDHLREWIATLQTVRLDSIGELLATSFGVQLALFGFLVLVWAVDGFPGAGILWRRTVGLFSPTVQ